MKKRMRYGLVLCLALCLLFTGTPLAAVGQPIGDVSLPAELAEEFVRVAGDDRLVLYLNEADGVIAVHDVVGDGLWHSTPTDVKQETIAKGVFKMSLYSLLTLTVIDSTVNGATPTTLTAYTECVLSDGGVSYTYLDNGFTVKLQFVDHGITVPLTVAVEEGTLCVAVDTAGIVETTTTWVRSVSLLPYFGAGNSEAEGYMLVPDGSGALIRFNNGKTTAAFYETELYGADLSKTSAANRLVNQPSYLPVFGLQNGDKGYLAVVEGATANAAVHAEVAGKRTTYNGVCAVFTLRDAHAVTIGDNQITDYEDSIKDLGTLAVRYLFYGDGGGYSRMADLYRQYLQQRQGLAIRSSTPATYVQVLCSYPAEKSFLGFPYFRQMPLTTYGETAELLQDLQAAGVEDLAAVLKNWDKGSVQETLTQRVQTPNLLGGGRGLSRLTAYGEEAGIPLYLTTRTVAYRKGGLFANFREAARNIDNVSIRRYPYSLSTAREDTTVRPQYLLAPSRLLRKVETLAKHFGKRSLTRIAVDDLATMIYADHTRTTGTTKTGSVTYFTQALTALQEAGMTMVSQGANAYALPYLTAVLGAPASHSGYDIEDEAVPFYQLVLNGVMDYTTPALNLSSDEPELFLWALESGSRPLYVLAKEGGGLEGSYSQYYSIAGDNWTEAAAQRYATFREIWDKTDGMAILSHELVAAGVALVTYENGSRLLVNRSSRVAETAWGTVDAGSFVFAEGEG